MVLGWYSISIFCKARVVFNFHKIGKGFNFLGNGLKKLNLTHSKQTLKIDGPWGRIQFLRGLGKSQILLRHY